MGEFIFLNRELRGGERPSLIENDDCSDDNFGRFERKNGHSGVNGKNLQENCHRKLGRGFGYGWVFNDFVLIFVYFSLLKQERIHFPLNHLLNTSMSGNLDGDGLPSFLVFIVDLPANQHILALDPNT